MSQSEDYLDGLLNSINRAKTDAEAVQENVEKKQQEIIENRKMINPDEDFFTATGIDVHQTKPKSSHPYLRKVLSEEDFLRKFEEELGTDDVDSFLSEFEQEIDDEEKVFEETGKTADTDGIIDKLLNDIDDVVSDETKKLEDEKEEEIKEETAFLDLEEQSDLEDSEEDVDSGIASEEPPLEEEESLDSLEDITDKIALVDDEDIDLSEFIEESEDADDSSEEEMPLAEEDEDDLGISLDDIVDESVEEPIDESMKEFMPDDMDALDEAQYGDGDEPDLSGEGDLDLDNLLEGDDEDLLDIQSLLNGDEEGASEEQQIDESAEAKDAEEPEEEGKKGKKKKKKKEKGEKKPNPFLQKLALIIFGAPDEDELAEMEAAKKAAEVQYDEEGNPIVPEDPKEKKKREKEEKKAAKEAAKKEKEAAKKEKEAAKPKKEKPKKEPKPKKEKKPKEPDNSPKIPISIIATFLVLSISIIGVVMVGMKFTGLKRDFSQSQEYFEQGNYIAAYERLNGYPLEDEKVILLRNQARTLADLQQCQDEYTAFMNFKMYNYALDSLLKGIGRYERYKKDAEEYGISEQYEEYGNKIISELQESFGLSVDDAMAIYKQPNRHYYTIELRKVLRGLGLPDT